MPLLPVALYGLEVPAGDLPVPAAPDFPGTFRITMAAIDPTAEIDEEFKGAVPRATLKIIRVDAGNEDEDSDEDEDAYMEALLGKSDSDSDDEEESEEEGVNGGPSDPTKSKKARKAAAVAQLISSLQSQDESDEDMEDAPNGVNGKASSKGKAKAVGDDDEEEDEDEDSDDDSESQLPEEFVLCTLDPEKNYQQPLDITIGEDEIVYFKVTGSHTIHLTGNYVIPDDDGLNNRREIYDSDSDEEEDYDLSPDEDELELEMEDDESDELDNLADPRITEVDSEEEKPKSTSKAEKKGKNKRTAEEEPETLDELMEKTAEPAEAANGEAKLSKKQLKKLKNNKGEPVAAKAAETEKPAGKGDKKVQFAKNLEQGPTGSTPEAKKAEPSVKVVQGVKIDDKKIGEGRQAKKGNKIGMRYIGKLQDGKVFDANKKGKPFTFKLGSGEVISGWDIGIAGMAVGGERRLTIPAHLAYGSKSQPGIPANSTLIFDVKCLEIN